MQLALGTVQFGLAYGIAGRGEPVPSTEVRSILELAHAGGIRMLDTAAAYGDIEERLAALCRGLSFRIVSKIAAPSPALGAAEAEASVRGEAERSCRRLGDALIGLMFHRGADLQGDGTSALWSAAAEVTTRAGLMLGASCYSPDELRQLRRTFPIAIAQLPGNAFDQRLREQRVEASLQLHLRSAFLQGLLLMSADAAAARLPAAAQALRRWSRWCTERSLSALQGALAVVKGMPASHVVVGVDRAQHLEEIFAAWDSVDALSAPELANEDLDVIDPRRWRAGP